MPEQCENILIVYLHTQAKPWSSSKSFPPLQLSLDRQTLKNKNKNKTVVQVLETWANWFQEFVSWVADPFRFFWSWIKGLSAPLLACEFHSETMYHFKKVNFPQRKYLSNTQMNRPLVTLSRFRVLPDAGPPFEVNTIPLLYHWNIQDDPTSPPFFFFLYKLYPSAHSLICMGIQ